LILRLFWYLVLGGLGLSLLLATWRNPLRVLAVFVGLIALLAALAASIYVWGLCSGWWALRRFRAAWRAKGKDLLLVYSNSPHWQQYVEQVWLPRWGHRAVVLNWSERAKWKRPFPPEVTLFRAFGGREEFNPLAIVVPSKGGHPKIVRFWLAFRDYKHGKDRLLREAEAELERYLGEADGLQAAKN
jgi:hypothetical protein